MADAKLDVLIQERRYPNGQSDEPDDDSEDTEDEPCQGHPLTLLLSSAVADLPARHRSENHGKDGKQHGTAQYEAKNPAHQRSDGQAVVLWR